MSIEDDITKVLAEWHAEPADPEAWQVAMFEDAVVRIMPLVKRAQAEALREAADSDQTKMFSPAVYVGSSSRRAFITARDWLHSEADRIESEVPDV